MYSTHAILVNIPDAAESSSSKLSEMTKEEIKEMVINYATNETERFAGHVFDYRDLLNEEDHDEDQDECFLPVVFASEDWKAFEGILISRDRGQKGYAKSMLEYLEEVTSSMDVSTLLNNLLLVNDRNATLDSVDPKTRRRGYHSQGGWALREIARLIYGEYTFESGFYDTYHRTAIIPFIEELKENPEDWAIVQYDYHW